MDALELLLNRSSQGQLQAPAPAGEVLQNILKAGLRAPDHAGLSPWQFVVVSGDGLNRLGAVYKKAAIASNMADKDIARAEQLPLRAPMLIVAIAKFKQHDKVPQVEQIAATACAVQNMQMAALAQGYGGMWRTGSYATNEVVRAEFGLQPQDEIVGFLYLGTPKIAVQVKPEKPMEDVISYWN